MDTDEIWFGNHPNRSSHIRNSIGDESNAQFLSLGDHDRNRRRIIIWRVPDEGRLAAGKLMKIPFLAFADESIRDEDETLLPIIHEIMMDAAKRHNIRPPKGRR